MGPRVALAQCFSHWTLAGSLTPGSLGARSRLVLLPLGSLAVPSSLLVLTYHFLRMNEAVNP